ncbi:ComEC/Rec2 family competence protein [Candidatus Saccharibacteria bacterium]|nr:ComEC/Rec2 family competence protein [Candidatus Saccharibacteria bacterium]
MSLKPKYHFHISILPIIFCVVVIALDIFALITGQISAPLKPKGWSKQSTPENEPLLIDFKTDFKSRIKSALPDESEGLALGYLLGDKSELGDVLKETIAAVGLTHLIVASGTHLGIILKFVRKTFGKLTRLIGLLSALFAVALFVGIIGLTPSALRAGLVAVMSLLAVYFGRDLKPGRLILYTATITILINPSYLINLSWLLSFASFSAILLLAPTLELYFYGSDKKPSFLGSLILASFSATLLTTPLLLFYFGQISFISVLANILISPTLALTMLLTFLTGLIPNPLTAFAAHLLVQYHIRVASFFADQTAFLLTIDKNNALVFLLYIPIATAYLYLRRANQSKLPHNMLQKPLTSKPPPAGKFFVGTLQR